MQAFDNSEDVADAILAHSARRAAARMRRPEGENLITFALPYGPWGRVGVGVGGNGAVTIRFEPADGVTDDGRDVRNHQPAAAPNGRAGPPDEQRQLAADALCETMDRAGTEEDLRDVWARGYKQIALVRDKHYRRCVQHKDGLKLELLRGVIDVLSLDLGIHEPKELAAFARDAGIADMAAMTALDAEVLESSLRAELRRLASRPAN